MLHLDTNPLAELVSRMRHERRWSRADVAALARKKGFEISDSYIAKIEKGGVAPTEISTGKYDALAAAFDLDSTELQQVAKGSRPKASNLVGLVPGLKRASEIEAPDKYAHLPPLAALIHREREGLPPIDLTAVSNLDPKMLKDIDRGKIPPDHLLRPLARVLGIPYEKMKAAATGKKPESQPAPNDYLASLAAMIGPQVEMPYYGKVGCGEFLQLAGNAIEWRPVPEVYLQNEQAANLGVLEAWGDSMNRAGPVPIHEGMQLLVRKQATARPGQVVIATVPHDGTTCKRLTKRDDGLYLEAESSGRYAPIKVAGEVKIDGVVLRAWMNAEFPG